MVKKNTLPRRDFLRNAVMLSGVGVTAPLWSAMKYDRNVVMRYFREWRANFARDATGGRLSFRGFCGTYEVEATSNGRTVKRRFHVGNAPSAPIEITLA